LFGGNLDLESIQKLVFESSEAVSVVSTFDDLGLKEDLVRGIYAYSTSFPHILASYK
jgi:ATP-dependent RNA helicase